MPCIREANAGDAEALQELYHSHLTTNSPAGERDLTEWEHTLVEFEADSRYHILVREEDGRIVSSVTIIVIPNLTHGRRPYALIENVVTHADYRGRHYASQLMARASEIAQKMGCYKIMLLTGSKLESTLQFYENCGFNCNDKTAFIKWL